MIAFGSSTDGRLLDCNRIDRDILAGSGDVYGLDRRCDTTVPATGVPAPQLPVDGTTFAGGAWFDGATKQGLAFNPV